MDHRTLYERLKQQKDKKQEEWEEQFKFSEWASCLAGEGDSRLQLILPLRISGGRTVTEVAPSPGCILVLC